MQFILICVKVFISQRIRAGMHCKQEGNLRASNSNLNLRRGLRKFTFCWKHRGELVIILQFRNVFYFIILKLSRHFLLLGLMYLLIFVLFFHWLGPLPLGRVSHRVALSVILSVCANGCIFLGLLLALRSHDQFPGLSLVNQRCENPRHLVPRVQGGLQRLKGT